MITTITMNASIDKAYRMDGVIQNGTVMRVASVRNTAGGKGLNVARVVKLCGAQVKASGLVGGFNGEYLKKLLDDDGIVHAFGHTAAETRSCINILDEKYGSTEYLEPGENVSDKELEQYISLFRDIAAGCNVITISGSLPKGASPGIYAEMIDIAKDMGKQVILDTSGAALQQGLKAKPTMVKPNQDEIEALFSVQIKDRSDVVQYAQQIHREGIAYVVVSLGGEGALLVCDDGVFQGIPPKVSVVNTVGCGDSMVGAFAVALEKKMQTEEMLRYAVAVGTANAMSDGTGSFDPKTADDILPKVAIQKLDE